MDDAVGTLVSSALWGLGLGVADKRAFGLVRVDHTMALSPG